MGKSLQEGMGEVQEMIDICDFAVGLSRQLYGLTMHSERPGHRMYEQWHPLGITGIISAFNFPVAVWSWNAACWHGYAAMYAYGSHLKKHRFAQLPARKSSPKYFAENQVPEGVSCLVIGGRDMGEWMANDQRIPLISATGSTRMGKAVGAAVGQGWAEAYWNWAETMPLSSRRDADLDIAVIGCCIWCGRYGRPALYHTRRLIIHESVYDSLNTNWSNAYKQLRIGDPLDEHNHVGPLIDTGCREDVPRLPWKPAGKKAENLLWNRELPEGTDIESGCYVNPCIAEVQPDFAIVQHETFAPILYIMKYGTMEEAIAIQNSVPQGLSSAIMTLNMREAE